MQTFCGQGETFRDFVRTSFMDGSLTNDVTEINEYFVHKKYCTTSPGIKLLTQIALNPNKNNYAVFLR